MQITKNKVATFHYSLKNSAGELLDSSEGQDPLISLQGVGQIVPGLEEALEGRKEGDKFSVSLSPEKGYGIRDEALVQKMPKKDLGSIKDLEIGMQLQSRGPKGMVVYNVAEIQDKEVVLDGNHPLAGEILNFDIEVIGVRDASEEELSHGHSHGPDGHHHH